MKREVWDFPGSYRKAAKTGLANCSLILTSHHLPIAKTIPMNRIGDPPDPSKVFSHRLKTAEVPNN
jgi:hypothetical protein